MVHDTGRGGEDDVTELTGGKELDDPLLKIAKLDVVTRADDTSLVETMQMSVPCDGIRHHQESLPAIELNHDLAVAVVVNFLEFTNVSYRRHVRDIAND